MVKVRNGVALSIIDSVCFASPAHTIVLQQRLPDNIAKGPPVRGGLCAASEFHGHHSRLAQPNRNLHGADAINGHSKC